jgi:type I restriction enzyme M protein
MITGELKSKVDRIWDTMWSGGISNPLSVIEQLTYLLFIKRLDELHTLREHKAARTGMPIENPVFTAEQEHLRWSRFKEAAPEQMFETLRDGVFPFIKTLGDNGQTGGEGGSTYTHHMKDALFMMPTARVLANVVDQLDGIDMADSDTKGDLYEYMLGKIATAGQNGQFRTPRHIIKLMVDMTAPTPKDVICDPACGTAGFLIAASEHLVEHHSDTIYKDAVARRRFNDHTFHGYDFDTTMLRIGNMNMLLHGVENPDIRYKDSLEEADDDDAEKYSLILANPPFAGSLDYESTAKGSAADRQDQEDRVALPRALPAPAPDGRTRRSHRARRRALRIEQCAQGPAQDPGRGAKARRHRFHALWRVQALRRGLHRHPALHQNQLRRHGQRVVLRHAGRWLLP